MSPPWAPAVQCGFRRPAPWRALPAQRRRSLRRELPNQDSDRTALRLPAISPRFQDDQWCTSVPPDIADNLFNQGIRIALVLGDLSRVFGNSAVSHLLTHDPLQDC